MSWIADALATGLAATTFLVAFSSVRLRAERDRAVARSDNLTAELSRATVAGRAVTDEEVVASAEALHEADRTDSIGSATVIITYGVAGFMVLLALVAGLRSGLEFSTNPFAWTENTWAVFFFLAVQVAVVVLGHRDYLWVGEDLTRRIGASALSKASAAIGLSRADEYDEALTLTDQVVARLPSWPWAHAFRAHNLLQLGRDEEARSAIDQAIALDPKNSWWHIARAEVLVRMSLFTEALDDLDSLDQGLRRNVEVLTLRGGALYGLGRREEALAAFDQAIKIDPDNPERRMRRGRALLGDEASHLQSGSPSDALIEILLDDGERIALDVVSRIGRSRLRARDAASAIEDFDVVLRQRPDDAQALVWRGAAKLEAGDAAGADDDFDSARRLGASPRSIHSLRASAFRRRGQLAGAVDEYSKWIAVDPSASAHFGRAMTYMQLSKYQLALNDFDVVVSEEPKHTDALAHRAEALAFLGETATSDAAFERALSVGTGMAHTFHVWIKTLLGRNRPDIAQLVLERALGLDQEAVERSRLLSLAGSVYAANKLYRRALAAFDEAATLLPDDPDVAYRRGICLADMGDKGAAIESLQIAASKPSLLQYAALGTRASLHRSKGALDLALADLNAAIGLAPEAPRLLVSRGCLYMEIGDFDAALADLNSALILQPQGRTALAHRMQVRARLGDLDGAGDDLAQLESLIGPEDEVARIRARAVLAESARDWEQVAKQYRLLIAKVGNDPGHLWHLAAAYVNASNFAEAEEIFKLLLREHGPSLGNEASLAVVLSQQGKSEEAIERFANLRDAHGEEASNWVKRTLHAEVLPHYDVVMSDWEASAATGQ
ncbi:tetratricopeptide repeat protein [Microbacterium sp. dk485]|uniref:tetratricopeptide repeat protein n=1 Tax=Microbacterium sp. dk485 TaxID=2560021 RepID=UPI0010733BFA|nr:tetratricopeptide repeat protein [Microbacterium sp. dk485]TFV81992.1 tetratricopeptide repeat protein [Microbacterium sp. dk485]